jgi:hypothetical protein
MQWLELNPVRVREMQYFTQRELKVAISRWKRLEGVRNFQLLKEVSTPLK